mgnify:CR=1 FL=1|tara:strand:- start:5512 stop:5982 length:471 start_codon:yes stop_codon:yes gene_type:complete
MRLLEKKHFKFYHIFDFNELSKLIDRNNFVTFLNGNWKQDYLFDNAMCLRDVQDDIWAKPLFNYLNKSLNKNNHKSDMHLFFNFSSGGKSIAHRDDYNVYIVGLYGKTLYKNNDEEIYLEQGDILEIKKGEEHRSISLTPRIIASYAFYPEPEKKE